MSTETVRQLPAASSSAAHPDLVRDSLRAGQEGVLERRAVGDGAVGGRDPPGVVEAAERVLDDDGEHFAGPAAGDRTLLDDDETTRLLDRRDERLAVERAQRAQ